MRVLVTGGLGFIGSETVLALIANKHQVVIVDDLANSKEKVLDRIEELSGVRPPFYKVDCCIYEDFKKVFQEEKFDAVIHFAGLKAVGESSINPSSITRTTCFRRWCCFAL
jgi:UDP-glucose 4-epimerase